MDDEEKQDWKRLIMAEASGEAELYIQEAKKFVYKYLPQKAIEGYLSPKRVYTEREYAHILWVMIHNFNLSNILRWIVEMKLEAGEEPDPYVLQEIRELERDGF